MIVGHDGYMIRCSLIVLFHILKEVINFCILKDFKFCDKTLNTLCLYAYIHFFCSVVSYLTYNNLKE